MLYNENNSFVQCLPSQGLFPLEQILAKLPDACLICDNTSKIIYANPTAINLFKLPKNYTEFLINRILTVSLRKKIEGNVIQTDVPSFNRRKSSKHRVVKGKSIDGEALVLELSISEIIISNEFANLVFCRTVLESQEQDFFEKESYQRLQTFVAFAPIGIFYLNANLDCEYVNDQWCRMTGLNIDESLGKGWFNAFVKENIQSIIVELQSSSASRSEIELELQVQSPLGKTIWVLLRSRVMQSPLQSRLGIVGSVQDINEQVKAKHSLTKLANYDTLTGLANRQLFISCLQKSILRLDRHAPLGLLFIDLNDFKHINDRFGHDVGDEYLKICTERIESSVREEDLVARLGGDEFTVLLENISDQEVLAVIAENIINHLTAPMLVGDENVSPGAAIGITSTDNSRIDANVLIKQADEAMYRAKQEEDSCYCFYSENSIAAKRSSIARNIDSILTGKEVSLWYQRQHCVRSSGLVGYEALMRWHSPNLGFVSPTQFISVLESNGLIHAVTHWLIKQIIHDFSTNKIGFDDIHQHVSFNLSARSVRDKQLVDVIKELLQEYPLARNRLICEITESVMLNDFELSLSVVDELKNMGVKIALDDFGTGYCSLMYLRKLPIDLIKIDKSFVAGMNSQDEDRTIVKTIVDLAHNLNMDVLAEGVEYVQQIELLKQLGCDYYQGYISGLPPELSLG